MKQAVFLLLFVTLAIGPNHALPEKATYLQNEARSPSSIENDTIGVRFGNNLRVRSRSPYRGTFKGRQEARVSHFQAGDRTNYRTNSTGCIDNRILIRKNDMLRFRSPRLKRSVEFTFLNTPKALDSSRYFLDSVEVFMSRTDERKFLTGTVQGLEDRIPRKIRVYYSEDGSSDTSYVSLDLMGRFAIPVTNSKYEGEICFTLDTTVVNVGSTDGANEADDEKEGEERVGLICWRITLPESTSVHIDVYFDDGLEKELIRQLPRSR
jgi:hypothetical protein